MRGRRTKRGCALIATVFALGLTALMGLHLLDSVQAYRYSTIVFRRLKPFLSADEASRLAHDLAQNPIPTGLSGTTRSIFTYALLLVLGIAVFHLLATSRHIEVADKILTVLSGAVSTLIGFDFGSKATKDAAHDRSGRSEKPPPRAIVHVDPSRAKKGQPVTVHGTGFGSECGDVHFGAAIATAIHEWENTHVQVDVPDDAPEGKTAISVNPSHAGRIVAANTLFEVVK